MPIDVESIPVVTPETEASAEAALCLIADVPIWVLANILVPKGIRLPARPKTNWSAHEINPQCGVCLFNVPSKERAIVNGITYHMDCWQRKNNAARTIALATGESRIATVEDWTNTSGISTAKDYELPGNLGDAEYHLWVGSRLCDSDFALCRACKFIAHGSHQRALHKLDSTRYTGQKPCWRVISEICKIAAMKNRCMVCKTNCALTRWGVHLCGWRCANDWKFNQEVHWLDFAINLLHIRQEALKQEKENHDARPLFN